MQELIMNDLRFQQASMLSSVIEVKRRARINQQYEEMQKQLQEDQKEFEEQQQKKEQKLALERLQLLQEMRQKRQLHQNDYKIDETTIRRIKMYDLEKTKEFQRNSIQDAEPEQAPTTQLPKFAFLKRSSKSVLIDIKPKNHQRNCTSENEIKQQQQSIKNNIKEDLLANKKKQKPIKKVEQTAKPRIEKKLDQTTKQKPNQKIQEVVQTKQQPIKKQITRQQEIQQSIDDTTKQIDKLVEIRNQLYEELKRCSQKDKSHHKAK